MKTFIYITLVLIPNIYFAQNFRVDNDNLDRNFAKWISINKNIYDNLKAHNVSKVNFIIFNSDSFYEKVKAKYNLTEHEDWSLRIAGPYLKIAGGYKSPIVAYDMEKKISVLLFVPNQWLNSEISDNRNCHPTIREHAEIGFITYKSECDSLINIDFRISNFEDGYVKTFDNK
jgi:hypothetical protein